MRLVAKVHILGKVQKLWKDSNGAEHMSCSANIMQDNGQVIDTIRLNEAQYAIVKPNESYTITADFGSGKNGPYLRVVDIVADKA